MASSSFTQWQQNDYPGDPTFRPAETGGPQPVFRDPLDKLRSQWRSTPEAQYPDGYLGTLNTRRQDRLLEGLKQRSQQRPYSRGIHKGDQRDMSDYLWPEEFNLMSGLVNEMSGLRYVSPGLSFEVEDQGGGQLTNDGKPNAFNQGTINQVPSQPNPDRVAQLRRLAPPWSRGPVGTIGAQSMATAYPGR